MCILSECFVLPIPQGLAHTDMLLPVGEVCVARGNLLSSSFVEASWHNLCWRLWLGSQRRRGGEQCGWRNKKASSSCTTEKGRGVAGWEWCTLLPGRGTPRKTLGSCVFSNIKHHHSPALPSGAHGRVDSGHLLADQWGWWLWVLQCFMIHEAFAELI